MKTSEKIVCVVIVVSLFATIFYLVHNFVNTANAGLHFTM